MKKLLLTEGLIACFFLMLLLGILWQAIGRERRTQKTSTLPKREEHTIRIYPGILGEEFSPLCMQKQAEEQVVKLCFSNLLEKDQDGKVCNASVSKVWKKGTDETAHISSLYDKDTKVTRITIQLNPELKTAKGTRLSADDLLFNYYLRLDSSSGAKGFFDGVHILGQDEYTYGTDDIEKRQKELKKMLQKPSDELKKQLQEKIVRKELLSEWQWAKGLYQDETYDFISSRYREPKDLFAYYYAYQTKYSSKGKSEKQVIEDIVKQYAWHTKRLEKITNKSYDRQAERLALANLLSKKGKDTVSVVSGIKKKDAHTVEICVKGENVSVEKVCDLYLLPLEEYGDKALFDGKRSFGFQKGTADGILKKAQQSFCGSGAFTAAHTGKSRIVCTKNRFHAGKKAYLDKIIILRKDGMDAGMAVREMLKKRIDIAILPDGKELERLRNNRATTASYQIRKKNISTTQRENCLIYRTSYVNAPSIPKKLTESHTVFDEICQLKVNP